MEEKQEEELKARAVNFSITAKEVRFMIETRSYLRTLDVSILYPPERKFRRFLLNCKLIEEIMNLFFVLFSHGRLHFAT